eukprot:647292-Pelagomonas_calceolata.AAC.2
MRIKWATRNTPCLTLVMRVGETFSRLSACLMLAVYKRTGQNEHKASKQNVSLTYPKKEPRNMQLHSAASLQH